MKIVTTSQGPHVLAAKNLLIENGFMCASSEYFSDQDAEVVKQFQACHLGPDGKFLHVTGVIDESTTWALENASGAPQRSGIDGSIPNGISGPRADVLLACLVDHSAGVHEVPNGYNRGPGIDECFPSWIQAKLRANPRSKGEPWCCFWASKKVHEATGSYFWGESKHHGSCQMVYRRAKARGAIVIEPCPGDLFLVVDRERDHAHHVGFVLRVSEDWSHPAMSNLNGTFETVEGNCGNRVKIGSRDNNPSIEFVRIFPEQDFDCGLMGVVSNKGDSDR